MAWVAVDKDQAEYVYESQPIRQIRFWFPPGDSKDVELPTGSIKKLIGRELTWDDEPVKLPG